ncbi:hypothetical protein DYBT9275_05668 [Dyadobacter sp. CECT 9275]|uniref:Sigma-70 family RNA polymerase sigma factor n=1 Tax=Dyadobacter helix TaxID=2822344 RepID=A0A916JIA2_9BACT|nr:sigma-70 family RNA polymerase sigma factor [Dyadobacter sp. CECT 9275]CAG5016940.1 hypothetical protein DYBT9275_05668 [Dyadobacter sp. CECT 9275]
MPDLSIPELWNAFRRGERFAFQQIYQLYAKDLISYGSKVTSDVRLIEDSIHDLFIELWQSRSNLSETDSIKFYLFRSLRNKINHAQRKDVFFGFTNIDNVHARPDNYVIENDLIEKERKELLLRRLHKSYGRLSPRQQQAIDLRFRNHFSNEEVARIMGINYQSACKFIYSALKVLRETVHLVFAVLWMGGSSLAAQPLEVATLFT